MRNPVLIELTRGQLVESVHAGALAVVGANGDTVCAIGDVRAPVFPRSAIKLLQAVPFVESGAIEGFGFGAAEIALCSGSHAGTPRHVAVAEHILARAGLTVEALACGSHAPLDAAAARELVLSGRAPSALHHNCSGKHAGMLATAVHKCEPTEGYWRPDHPVQLRIREALENMSGSRLGADTCGIDGCSVPNWAIPLERLGRAFARLVSGEGLSKERAQACRRIAEACWAEPELVAGTGRLDTRVMQKLPGKVLLKSGAEGVYCGAFPARGLGFALKIDDGAKRAAEMVAAELISRLYPDAGALAPYRRIRNWRGVEVGQVRTNAPLAEALARIV